MSITYVKHPAFQPISTLARGDGGVGYVEGHAEFGLFRVFRHLSTGVIVATFESTVPLDPLPTHWHALSDAPTRQLP